MKIQVYENDQRQATYKVGDKYYGFLDKAPRNQEEFEAAMGPNCRKGLVAEMFGASPAPERLKLTYVCEVEV